MEKIESFRGEYFWLSNFYPLEKPKRNFLCHDLGAIYFPTAEHFYQGMKFDDWDFREQISKHPSKGLKKFARTQPVRNDWDDIKLKVMEFIIKYKFSNNNPILKQKLIETGNIEIVEGNWWNDKFWGYCLKTNEGENHLGKIIMKVREEIR